MSDLQQYDESSVTVLKGLEPVKQRPGMYTRTDNPTHICQEVIDNAADEALGGYADTISVAIHSDGSMSISDNGRGIPVGLHPTENVSVVELVFTRLHAGGKFNKKDGGAYAFSGGLHGVGVSVTNALSTRLEVQVKREGKISQIVFSGGLLLAKPDSLVNPFFMLAPEWGRWPLLLLAAFATIIASQAVISGAFSVTRQAIQLGFSPRLSVIHTSSHEQGQIYLPLVNWLLLAAVAAVMLGFQSSEHLAAAYGIAVTGTMLMTSCLLYIVMRRHWHWPKAIAIALTAVFLSFDVVFFSANLLKFTHGGWLPCVVAAILVFIFATWYQGQQVLAQKNLEASVPLDGLIEGLSHGMPHQVDGIAIYMVRELDLAPKALLHNLKHNQVLHEHNILLNIVTDNQPYVEREQRLQFKRLNEQFSQMTVHYGFKQTPDLLKVMAYAQEHGYELELMRTSFFLASDSLALAPQGKLSRLRTRLFIWLARNQTQITDYCHIPHNRVVSLGGQIML